MFDNVTDIGMIILQEKRYQIELDVDNDTWNHVNSCNLINHKYLVSIPQQAMANLYFHPVYVKKRLNKYNKK